MSGSYVKIPLSRLLAGRAFAREIYLSMPKRGSLLRIAARNGELTESFLRRLAATPAREVFALPEPGDDTDPERFPLYAAGDTPAPAAAPESAAAETAAPATEAAAGAGPLPPDLLAAALSAGETEAAGAAARTAETAGDAAVSGEALQAEEAARVAAMAGEPESETAVAAADGETEAQSQVTADGEEAEAQKRLQAARAKAQEKNQFEADAGEAMEEQRISGEEEAAQGGKRIKAGAENEPEDGQLFQGKEGDAKNGKRFFGHKEDTTFLRAAAAAREARKEKEGAELQGEALSGARFSSAGDGNAEAEEEMVFSADEPESRKQGGLGALGKLVSIANSAGKQGEGGAQDSVTVFDADAVAPPDLKSIGQDLSGFIERFRVAADANGQEKLRRLGQQLDAAGEGFRLFSSQPEAAGQEALPGLARALSECITAVTALEDSGEETVLSTGSGLRAALELAASAVEEKLQNAESASTFFSPSAIVPADSMSSWSTAASSSESSLDATSRAAHTHREMPQIAGRLAAMLGHSLGYGNQEFLSDLALSTIVFFSAKFGAKIDGSALTPLNRATLADQDDFGEGVFEDSRWIIGFLKAYFENPECDRSLKEFSKRVFETTLEKWEREQDAADPGVTARWRQFVSRGPTMAAVSASSKATAHAVKAAKEFISEIPL